MRNSGCTNNGRLFFVFDELNRKTKPCLNLQNVSDVLLFVDAMNFTKKNCVELDGACSSRVYTSMAYLSNLLNPPSSVDEPDVNIDELLKDALTNNCGTSCCDCSSSL